MKKPVATSEDSTVRILKISTCPSLSKKSTLTYHIGCRETPNNPPEIQFRIYSNSGRGFFSREWVSAAAIQKIFEKIPVNVSVTAASIKSIFHGKSVNTSGFLIAVLLQEGLILAMKNKRQGYERINSDAFVSEIQSLIASQVSLNPDAKPGQPVKASKKTIQAPVSKKS